MGISEAKVPTIVSTGIICFLVGLGAGVVGRSLYYEGSLKPGSAAASTAGPSSPGMPSAPSANGAVKGKMGMPGGGPPGMGRGRRGPSPKNQLASLVVKLDLLSQKPLAIRLDESQKKKVREQLQGLEVKATLSDEEAKGRLDGLLDTLKGQKETLEAAGYRWPGEGGFRRPADTPNPFKEEKNGKALKSLQDRLAK